MAIWPDALPLSEQSAFLYPLWFINIFKALNTIFIATVD